MRPEDVYALVNAGDPRLHPDGRRVAYVVTGADEESNEYRSAIWVAQVDGSSGPVRFTSGERRDTTPRWSPDGTKLAFSSNRTGKLQVYTMNSSTGGNLTKITSATYGAYTPSWFR